jgi:valyl-tRNA synthetase
MINWDPEAETTVSDEEVNYVEEESSLYYLNYPIDGSKEKLIIATTRPETIFGDTAVCVNPKDKRYSKFVGKEAIVPICDRKIPIISDPYVDIEFGTGCLKVTPAHDLNDYNLRNKHKLEIIDIFDSKGRFNENGLHYKNKDRFEVRKEIVKELKEKKILNKSEVYKHNVGRSDRTNAIIEPKISRQWFLKMDQISKPAITNVLKNENIKFFPKKFKSTYRYWLENIKDWNISRQLSWGHQIPAFYYGENKEEYVVAQNKNEAKKIIEKQKGLKLKDDELIQDEDVLDTWFSSWLWPISVFDGIRNPENQEIKYYYPTQDLVTGPDIIFFWVARMIISGYEFRDEKPFSNVYFTGIVRDKLGRKMSKQLGNSPDAIELIDKYGADSVRVGLMLSSAAGNDLLFDESLCQQGKNFTNKLWNALRLVNGWEVDDGKEISEVNSLALEWYENKFNQVLDLINKNYKNYRISDVLMSSYRLVWDDYCSWLLESVKPEFGEKIDNQTKSKIISLFEDNLKLLHPFMPFLTEEIWYQLASRTSSESITISKWPDSNKFKNDIIINFEIAKDIISYIRNFRKEKNIPFKKELSLYFASKTSDLHYISIIKKLVFLNKIEYSEKDKFKSVNSFIIGSIEFFIPLEGDIDLKSELDRLNKELDYNLKFLKSVENKLKNKSFIDNAPKDIVEKEKKKVSDAKSKIEVIKKALSDLS